MPALTDGQIKRSMKRVAASKKPETLTDGEGRGTGRLVLILKPQPTRVTSSFFAQQWSDGKRKLKKIGDYPHVTLAEARAVFERDFAAAINKGSSIKVQGDTRPGTVGDLFEAYCDALEEAGKSSHKEARKGLAKIADVLGRNRLARDITPEATYAVATRSAPGIAEAMRCHSLSITPRGMLSRAASVLRGKTLIVNLPGSPKAVQENLEYILPSLEHGIRIAAGLDGECARK